ncbi:RDD family protein [Novosphingobium olei]|uniref:RDD family protein n=1 Tax=Novosphingobium olei TaxID=2728851 RepID=A0A7Y0BSL9_9SPHN|nr:RDD family protein [Novosphingobium olei]NML95824.1 RDD family protein [Novosphingobium olei]
MSARRATGRIVPDAERRKRWLTTPEGVALPFVLASRGTRAAALAIDLFLVGAAMVATTLALLWMAQGLGLNASTKGPAGHALQALAIVWFVVMFLARNAWFLAFELGPRGATPGKRLLGIRVAARDGGRLTTEAVIARNLVRDIELFMPLVFIGGAASSGGDTDLASWAGLGWFALFMAMPFLNRDALRCGDMIAGTWVVEAQKRKLGQALSLGGAAAGPSAATGAVYRFGPEELSVYGEYELQALERVLREGRADTMAEVAATICGKIGWSAGAGDERAFLEAYYTQLRAHLERGMRFGRRKADKFA